VIKKTLDWFDDRTEYRQLLKACYDRKIPGGPRWGYAIGAALFWLLVVQVVTGLLMMGTYNPSMSNAWASVHYIESAPGGAFLRGVHFWASQAMIVLGVVYVLRLFILAAFRAPHELSWITGFLFLPLIIVWAVTGNPLAGSQEGLAQVKVESAIVGSLPGLGASIKRLLLGGNDVGNLTLTHLYVAHVALLPLAAAGLLMIHSHLTWRHGPVGARPLEGKPGCTTYWPQQSFRNAAVFTVVLMVVCGLACVLRAPFHAPFDEALPHSPRPVWYMLSPYQLQAYFPTAIKFFPTMVLPGIILGVMVVYPWIDRFIPKKASMTVRIGLVVLGMGGVVAMTGLAMYADANDKDHLKKVALNEEFGKRSRVLADHQDIPPEGARELLRNDPKTMGPLLFEQHCASCHSWLNEAGEGIAAEDPSASNLYGFGTKAWVSGWLDPDRIVSEHYFGKTAFAKGEMVRWITSQHQRVISDDDKKQLADRLDAVADALVGGAQLPYPGEDDQPTTDQIVQGQEVIRSQLKCTQCHGYDGELGYAPDLTDYASRDWLIGIISNPEHERFYPDTNDRMPAFAKNASDPRSNLLTDREVGLIADWLRGDWFEAGRERVEYPEQEAAETAAPNETAVVEPTVPLGQQVFQRHCASCHAFTNSVGEGIAVKGGTPSAPNLYGIGTADWIAGWFDPERIVSQHYWGGTPFLDDGMMVEVISESLEVAEDDGELDDVNAKLAAIARALQADAGFEGMQQIDEAVQAVIDQGRQLIDESFLDYGACTDCHTYSDDPGDFSEGDYLDGPDLSGYCSREWLKGMIANPEHGRFYPGNNADMPAFRANPEAAEGNKLTEEELDAVVDWMRAESVRILQPRE